MSLTNSGRGLTEVYLVRIWHRAQYPILRARWHNTITVFRNSKRKLIFGYDEFMVSALPDRIDSIMKEYGLNRSAFAESIGLSPSKFTKSMSGARRFTLTDLSVIADKYEVSIDWLLGKYDSSHVAARRNESVPVDTLVAKAKEHAVRRHDLTELGIQAPWNEPTGDYANGLVRAIDQGNKWGDAAASSFQEAREPIINLSNEELFDAVEAFFGADICVVPGAAGVDGVALTHKSSRVIALAASTQPARQRFTLGHELSHLIVDDDQAIFLDEDVMDTNKSHSEIRANAFSAAFLMPRDILSNRFGNESSNRSDDVALHLAFDLGVTPTSLAYRLLNLGFIDQAQCSRLKRFTFEAAAKSSGDLPGFAIAQSQSNSPRTPKRLIADTYQAFLNGWTTLKPFAKLIGSTVSELRESIGSDALAKS